MEENNGYAICFNKWALDKSIKDELGLLLIISSLCAENGYCFASNEYFANLFDISQETVSRKIKLLERKNYIKIEYDKRGCEIKGRYIRLTNMSIDDYQICQSTIDENVKDNNTSINNNKEIDNNKLLSTKKFIKPTVEEIKKYCEERNNNIDAEEFYDFYESKGWKIGKSTMKDWKASIRTWERNDKKTTNKKNNRSYLDELEEKWKKEGTI